MLMEPMVVAAAIRALLAEFPSESPATLTDLIEALSDSIAVAVAEVSADGDVADTQGSD